MTTIISGSADKISGYLITSGACPYIEIHEKQLRIFANGDLMNLNPYIIIGKPGRVEISRATVDDIIACVNQLGDLRKKEQEIYDLAKTIFHCGPDKNHLGEEFVEAIRLKPQTFTIDDALSDITEMFIPTMHMRVWSNGRIMHACNPSQAMRDASVPERYGPVLRCFWSCIPFLVYFYPELRQIQESLEENRKARVRIPLILACKIKDGYRELSQLAIGQMALHARISELVRSLFP